MVARADFEHSDGADGAEVRFTGRLTLARLGDVPARLDALGPIATLDLPTAADPPGAELFVFEPEELDAVVTSEVGGSALFAARFRECAARALLLPRYHPGKRSPLWQQRQRASQLLDVARKYPAFPIILETANGQVRPQSAQVAELSIGNIVARDLAVVVSPAFGDIDVLGMNFLSRLHSWRVEGRTLILEPKANATDDGNDATTSPAGERPSRRRVRPSESDTRQAQDDFT